VHPGDVQQLCQRPAAGRKFKIGEDVMVMLKEALETERERKKREIEETTTQREAGRAILQALTQRLTSDPVPNWHFMLGDDAVSVLRIKGANLRERVGSWVVDQEMKLVFGPHTTEWITAESWSRAVDEAVKITAKVIVDAESPEVEAPQLRIAHP
jgi:hypothetical protein